MAVNRQGGASTGSTGGNTVITLVIGALIGILLDEAFLRSGYHPVSLSLDPALLKSAVGNDPELEAVLRLNELRQDNAEQQKALQEARRHFETLEKRYNDLEQDFHAAINMKRPMADDAPRLPLTPDCILAVRAARQRACPCDTNLCPIFYTGDTCEYPADDLPQCLATWRPPFQNPDGPDFHMWTLNQQMITAKNMHTLNLGSFDDAEDVVVELTKNVMELLPAKEVLDPVTYKSCAVVGSSDNLLRQFLGDEINDHDVIIRFNGATTKGYEKHVGRLTNIRFVTNSWLGFRVCWLPSTRPSGRATRRHGHAPASRDAPALPSPPILGSVFCLFPSSSAMAAESCQVELANSYLMGRGLG
uniref:beta-galactoside alpha-(2,6)-sialyltransferase n=1 Tax=Tetraselmis sp. GSL018 TaxID=582737 RepID=A0A061SB48_9CHLO